MEKLDNVYILIPTYNEEKTISDVITKCKDFTDSILVIDGNSTDNTMNIAENLGVTVIKQETTGKGAAIMEGLSHVDSSNKIIVLIDGDGTYELDDLPCLVSPISQGETKLTIANRLGKHQTTGAFSFVNKIGNKIISKFIQVLYRTGKLDVLSGFRAFHSDLIEFYLDNLRYNGFEVEAEMTILASRAGYNITSIESAYYARPKGSNSKLSPIKDGVKIFLSSLALKFRDIN